MDTDLDFGPSRVSVDQAVWNQYQENQQNVKLDLVGAQQVTGDNGGTELADDCTFWYEKETVIMNSERVYSCVRNNIST
jgi:hypothetical protein